ncbi:MAG: T9SS type A sorting domain-containing protein [Bacteroidota bacterium]|jgi:hypothetical protein
MKRILLTILACALMIPMMAQQVYDNVSINQGYTNQVFYSMPDGEVSNISNTDWDLAFQIAGFQATIQINGKNNVRLFKSGFSVNDWSNIIPLDTTGQLTSANELFNRDTSLWAGAFNITGDPNNLFDLGWGNYDFVTHAVTGDSIFFIKLPNSTWKKIWIQVLQNGTYTFVHANLDGTNETTVNVNKQNFQGKNFGYYSFATNTVFDREPNKYTWDLVFSQYMSSMPLTYKVTGVLSNDSVFTAKAYPVDEALVTPWGLSFNKYSNNIGYTWKTFDLNTNQWLIEDSTVYYVYGRAGGLWKLVFTGFGGASTGNFEFYKQQVSATGVNENENPVFLSAYPNPASDLIQLTLFVENPSQEDVVMITDMRGAVVMRSPISNRTGLFTEQIAVGQLPAGIYNIRVIAGGQVSDQRISVVK